MTGFWYNGQIITDHSQLPEDVIGFIYLITFEEGLYVGRKLVKSLIKKPMTKKYKLENPRKKIRRELVEHAFQDYCGSLDGACDLKVIRKEILHLCTGKKQLTYWENKELYSRGVLESEEYLNQNIQGKIFKKDTGLYV